MPTDNPFVLKELRWKQVANLLLLHILVAKEKKLVTNVTVFVVISSPAVALEIGCCMITSFATIVVCDLHCALDAGGRILRILPLNRWPSEFETHGYVFQWSMNLTTTTLCWMFHSTFCLKHSNSKQTLLLELSLLTDWGKSMVDAGSSSQRLLK